MSKAIDHTGVRYGRVVGIRPTGMSNKNQQKIWLWRCDCGAEFESVAGTFVYRDYSHGCASCVKETIATLGKQNKTTHGMCKSKEYRAWCDVKSRVFNPNHHKYDVYSKLGMDENLAKSFEAFYNEIGPYPTGGERYSVDRVDSTKGYIVGNIRWATYKQQARNRRRSSNNTSGVTGVRIVETRPGNFSAVAEWCDLNGKVCKRSFSFKKYGEELAMLCATEARDQAIRLLNQLGAEYSPGHGN